MKKRRRRNRYPGDPTEAAQQRLIGHLIDVAGPDLTPQVAQEILQRANAWKFIPMRELDHHLTAHPDAFTNPGPHFPRCLPRVAHALIAAGMGAAVNPPRCVVCGRGNPDLGTSTQPHPEGLGRCCQACMIVLTVKPCSRCGKVGAGTARRAEGIICRTCYRNDPDRQILCAGCGRTAPIASRNSAGEPLCQACHPRRTHPCIRCDTTAPAQAITDAGPVCKRCYEAPERACGRCARVRQVARRAHDDQPDLCHSCYQGRFDHCTACNRFRPGHRSQDRFRCYGCLPRPRRTCAGCVKERTVQAYWPMGPVCAACYNTISRAPAPCHVCDHTRVLLGRDTNNEPICGYCAETLSLTGPGLKTPRDYTCSSCGASGACYAAGRCAQCVATDRVTDLLSGDDDTMSAHLVPLAEALLTAMNPQVILKWMAKAASARLLARLAVDAATIDHDVLDQLPRTSSGDYLRQLLIVAGVLPNRLEPLERLEPWLARKLAGRPRHQALLIQPFAQWVVLRRARRDAQRGRYTANSADHSRGQLREALRLLDWLDARDLAIDQLTQPLLEDWFTDGNGAAETKIDVASFLAWTAARRLTEKLHVTTPKSGFPSRFLSEEDRLDLLRRCLTSDIVPLEVRVAGALVLLFGFRIPTVAALRVDQLVTDERGTYLTLTSTRLLLPPSLARLMELLATRPPRVRITPVSSLPRYLMPGLPPSRPINASQLGKRLRDHGIYPGKGQNAALLALAARLPAPVLATLLGLSPTTAEKWSRYAQTDWAAFLACRVKIHE